MIEVAAAIIFIEDKILCLKRGYSKYDYVSYKYEFPGGKLKNNETPVSALKREIKEELSINIKVFNHIASEKHKDEKIDVNVHYFLCESLNDNIILSEHEDMKWIQKNDLKKFKMAPGDSKIIKYLD